MQHFGTKFHYNRCPLDNAVWGKLSVTDRFNYRHAKEIKVKIYMHTYSIHIGIVYI